MPIDMKMGEVPDQDPYSGAWFVCFSCRHKFFVREGKYTDCEKCHSAATGYWPKDHSAFCPAAIIEQDKIFEPTVIPEKPPVEPGCVVWKSPILLYQEVRDVLKKHNATISCHDEIMEVLNAYIEKEAT